MTHYYERWADHTTPNSTGLEDAAALVGTVSAADLSGAGFSNSDEVLVLVYARISSNTNNRVDFDVRYGGTSIFPDAQPAICNRAGNERFLTLTWMERVSLGVLADFTIRAANPATNQALVPDCSLFIVDLADFGTEDTDWYWDESSTDATHTTSYSGTDRAAITWTPSGVEDWVYFAGCWIDVRSTFVNHEGRATIDTALDSGDWSEEGRGDEETPHLWWSLLASLSAASHTLAIESRDHAATAANVHRASNLLVFRKAVWDDLYVHEPGNGAVDATTDTQVATVTATLSEAQDIFIWGHLNADLGTASNRSWVWVRQDGSAVLEPAQPSSSNIDSVSFNADARDEMLSSWMGYVTNESGALDLDLFTYSAIAFTAIDAKLLVWGMGGGGGAAAGLGSQVVWVG